MISLPENPFHSAYDIPVIPGRFVFLNIFVERKRIRTMGRTILTPLRLLLPVVLTVLAGDAAAAIRCVCAMWNALRKAQNPWPTRRCGT